MIKLNKIFALLLFSTLLVHGQVTSFPFEEGFETGTLNPAYWTAHPDLANNGLLEIGNDWGVDESYGIRMGKVTDADGVATNFLDLLLDFSGVAGSQLKFNFWISDFHDENDFEDGVYFSDNGGSTFQKIEEIAFISETWATGYWGPIKPYGYDLDELISNYGLAFSSQFVIRFQQQGTGNFSTSGDEDGIMLDDISIYFEKPIVYQPIPHFEDFESSDNLRDYHHWHIRSCDVAGKTAEANIMDRFASIDIANDWGTGASYGLRLGKWRDIDGLNLNAIDLLLDLSGAVGSQLKFNFQISDYYDDNHYEDGVYFSDDGGVTFQKIEEISFTPEPWVNNIWGAMKPYGYDLDQLMTDYGLTYSNQFVIRFQQLGTHDFNTLGLEDGIMIDNVSIDFDKPMVYQTVPHFEDFESSDNLADYHHWHIRSCDVADKTAEENILNRFGLIDIANDWGANGSYGLRLGKSRDEEGENLNAIDFLVNLSNTANSELKFSFQISDYYDANHYEDGVYFSDDGGVTFEKINEISFTPEIWDNNIWGAMKPYGYDLDQLMTDYGLTYSNQFVIRFQQLGTHDFNTLGLEDGIMIDNVSIDFDKIPEFQTLPFCDNFFDTCISTDNCPLSNAWYISNCKAVTGTNPTSPNPNTLTRFSFVQIVNGQSSDGDDYSLYMGKSRDNEGYNTNAVDLHLNLAGHQSDEVILSFWLSDFADENHLEDAIYFSADGGNTWEKVYSIQPESLSSGFQYIELNMSDLINGATALSFTSNFVVRFQQYDNADFNTSGDEDGFRIDDVQVYANGQTCQVVGVEDGDFQNNTLAIYPNPTNGIVHLQTGPSISQNATVQLINLQGQVMHHQNISTQSNVALDFSHYADGIYIFKITSEGTTYTQKLVITQ